MNINSSKIIGVALVALGIYLAYRGWKSVS
jgi:hypothetical protein